VITDGAASLATRRALGAARAYAAAAPGRRSSAMIVSAVPK
jgi:hypothetical protein